MLKMLLVFFVVLRINLFTGKWNLRESMILLYFDEIQDGRTGQTCKSEKCERKTRIVL